MPPICSVVVCVASGGGLRRGGGAHAGLLGGWAGFSQGCGFALSGPCPTGVLRAGSSPGGVVAQRAPLPGGRGRSLVVVRAPAEAASSAGARRSGARA